MIVLEDASGKYNVLSYRSFKIRRFTRSVLVAEMMAFFQAFDCAYVLKREL